MFFLAPLEHTVFLHPKHCGSSLRTSLMRQLHEEVEGKCNGRHGIVICVHSVISIGHGIIKQATGFVAFKVQFVAITFHPFRKQVIDAIVSSVTHQGFWVEIGPMAVFIKNMPTDFQYDPNQTAYVSHDATVKISVGDLVRVQIINYTIQADGINGVGTMAEDYLGKIG